jgi:hypothetical protein
MGERRWRGTELECAPAERREKMMTDGQFISLMLLVGVWGCANVLLTTFWSRKIFEELKKSRQA